MHNRGLAIDLTLVDQNGNELEMGTPYDYFGIKSHSDYTDFDERTISNRNTLRQVMEEQGFKIIKSEWWHFNLEVEGPLLDHKWDCQ